MKFFTVLALMLALNVQTAMAYTEVTDQNYKQTLEKTADTGANVALTFYASWCPHCKNLEPKLDAAEKKFKNVKFMRVDIEKNPMLGHGIPFFPLTVLLKNKTGAGLIKGDVQTQKELDETLEKTFGSK